MMVNTLEVLPLDYATAVYPVFPITLLLELTELHDCDKRGLNYLCMKAIS